jgi:hypothetical protein
VGRFARLPSVPVPPLLEIDPELLSCILHHSNALCATLFPQATLLCFSLAHWIKLPASIHLAVLWHASNLG